MNTVIQVDQVSKVYRLGEIGTGTASRDLHRWWMRMRGKEDPFAKLNQVNDRTVVAGKDERVSALTDVSFNVSHGDVIGIIGRNGAGKSTLLKILSRITAPTTGAVRIKGRIASLLEVGTGFHPEMTGRENIYMNGTIMGLSRYEVGQKLDEIVEFAGVAKYIETPVKRYSSGMMVRLGFAVAAHLEPEILIVDEVLAVGDAEFQKKCLGKMKDVSTNEGRTILFVSHNMTAVKSLCKKAVYLRNGTVVDIGPTNTIVNQYLSHYAIGTHSQEFSNIENAPGNDLVKMKSVKIDPKIKGPFEPIIVETPINIEFEFWNSITDKELNLSLFVNTIADEVVFNVGTAAKYLEKGVAKGVLSIPGNLLNDGIYKISVMVVAQRSYSVFFFQDIASFEITDSREASGWHGKWSGFVRPNLPFSLDYLPGS